MKYNNKKLFGFFFFIYIILLIYVFVFNKNEIKVEFFLRFKEIFIINKKIYWWKMLFWLVLLRWRNNRILFWNVVLGFVKFIGFLWMENLVMGSMNEVWFIYDRSGCLV